MHFIQFKQTRNSNRFANARAKVWMRPHWQPYMDLQAHEPHAPQQSASCSKCQVALLL